MQSFEIAHRSQAHGERRPALRLRGLLRRVAAGADLIVAIQRRDLARVVVSWSDFRRR